MNELAPASNRDYLPIPELDRRPREECGVGGVWDPDATDNLEVAWVMSNAIQHRGEEGAGIAVVSPTQPGIHLLRGKGTVMDVMGSDGARLQTLPSDTNKFIIQTRYGTDKAVDGRRFEDDGAQPRRKRSFAGGHNGQFANTGELAEKYEITDYTTDSDLVFEVIDKLAVERFNGDVERATLYLLPELRGAFCLTILTEDKLIAVRDRHGVRPLQLGRTKTGGYMVASEVHAMNKVDGATWEREIEPAEMLVISDQGVRSGKWAEADQAPCVFEYIYLSNKENIINGITVKDARYNFGVQLAEQVLAESGTSLTDRLDMITPVPNSAKPSARGLADAAGLPYVEALTRNPEYEKANKDSRSFLQPNDDARKKVAKDKVIVAPRDAALVAGKRVGLDDDSLVRGHTARANIQKVRDAGAKEVHVFVPAPAFESTCNLGVDIGDPNELLAVQEGGDVEAMRRSIGANSLRFLTLERLKSVVGEKICTRCIGGTGPNPTIDMIPWQRPNRENITGQISFVG